MPIFEYRCRECGEMIERIQSSPSEEVECPRCGKPAKRVVSIFSGASANAGGCSAPTGSGFG